MRRWLLPQQELPKWLSAGMGAGIMAIGSVETSLAHNDNSPVSKINFDDYLIVSVNGNDDDINPLPGDDEIKASIPVAVYEGGAAA